MQQGAQMLQNAYGQFFRDGGFPGFANYANSVSYPGETNVISGDGLFVGERFSHACSVLNSIDDYTLSNWAFRTETTTGKILNIFYYIIYI